MAKKKQNRIGKQIRLKPFIAEKLGFKIRSGKDNRYYLNAKQLKQYLNLDLQPVKRLFFDIETSPMIAFTWRIGWKLNIGPDNILQDWKVICISYKFEDENKVHNLRWDENQCDKKMLQDFIKIANTADELVAHNGDRFDIKKIRTRCIFHRIAMFPNYRTLDTLKKAKAGFVFNSNRLDYIAKFLGVGAKLKHEGFQMWVKCMQGDKEALDSMVKYCDMDIVVLEDVFLVLQSYVRQNIHAGTLNEGRKCDCPACGSERTDYLKLNVTAAGTPKRLMKCEICKHAFEISNAAYRKYLGL